MAMVETDSIVKGKVIPKSKPPQSEGSKLHRGFTVCATGTPSIPSRYLTIISKNNERQGFHQTAKRFQDRTNFTPGPGHYETVTSLDKQLEKTSDSRKGTGSFASNSKRPGILDIVPKYPSPGTYNIPSIFDHRDQQLNQSTYSSMFQKPIAERPLSPKATAPAPNQYDVNQGFKTTIKANNVTAQAAFRSHTRRSGATNKHFVTPAPGAYNLEDSVTRSIGHFLQSSFKSTSKRYTFDIPEGRKLPGPADYRPYEKPTVEPHRQVFPRHHYLTISAPAIPPPPENPPPGPGAYEVRDFKENDKKYMSSAVFVSSTSRWALDTSTASVQPGPGAYTPRAPMKQSFNFNFEGKWIS